LVIITTPAGSKVCHAMKLLFTGPNPNPSPNPSPYSDVYHCVMVDLRAG